MSADLLREAAKTMRERAEAATPGPWALPDQHVAEVWQADDSLPGSPLLIASTSDPYASDDDLRPGELAFEDAQHIASWHPAVAPFAAEWLEATARELDALGDPSLDDHPLDGRRTAAYAFARAYLGDPS